MLVCLHDFIDKDRHEYIYIYIYTLCTHTLCITNSNLLYNVYLNIIFETNKYYIIILIYDINVNIYI